ncbi:hypothetical protein [Polaromonas hydrogenivorans]|uniref:Uncharacterized protein n=1 Tax=Polaromonas hydrogenivorans TaxID=335476 RepID=A0AAU7LYH1_9BURK
MQNFLPEGSADEPRAVWRATDDIPLSGSAISSPHDTEARRGCKGQTEWIGFKVYLTETYDTATPNLITNVETTAATVTDDAVTPVIHAALQQRATAQPAHHRYRVRKLSTSGAVSRALPL